MIPVEREVQMDLGLFFSFHGNVATVRMFRLIIYMPHWFGTGTLVIAFEDAIKRRTLSVLIKSQLSWLDGSPKSEYFAIVAIEVFPCRL